MKKTTALSVLDPLLFAAVTAADYRVADWSGAAFWLAATVLLVGTLIFAPRQLGERRWLRWTRLILRFMSVAVLIIRVGFGYTG